MRKKTIILVVFTILMPLFTMAQNNNFISPTATYIDDEGVETETSTDIAGQAPLSVTFRANPADIDDYSPTFEWHFRMQGESKDFMVRYEEDTEYTFTASGTCLVTVIVSLGNERLDSATISVTISESKLVFPNTFTPNNDSFNDIYQAKEYSSIVEFHAYIFNRWGQKLYDWTDPATGWDGTYNGKDVKEGVYFVLVDAKGADGREYHIKKDVNLLRNYTEVTSVNN